MTKHGWHISVLIPARNVLVGLHKRLHELGWDQLHVMALFAHIFSVAKSATSRSLELLTPASSKGMYQKAGSL